MHRASTGQRKQRKLPARLCAIRPRRLQAARTKHSPMQARHAYNKPSVTRSRRGSICFAKRLRNHPFVTGIGRDYWLTCIAWLSFCSECTIHTIVKIEKKTVLEVCDAGRWIDVCIGLRSTHTSVLAHRIVTILLV
jgi:hypothetical protein